MRENNFDRVAPFYDGLARLVFGNALEQAQLAYLHHLEPKSRLLVLGGGTGWILERLLEAQPELQIDYVEASKKMMDQSRGRSFKRKINFIHGTQADVPGVEYDAIITHFFLDVFSPKELAKVMGQLEGLLKPDGLWLCADFRRTDKAYHQFLLWLMHRFFKVMSRLQASQIQDFHVLLTEEGLQPEAISYWKKGLIFSSCYRKVK